MKRALGARAVPNLCVLVALIAGAAYAEAVPPWEAPDEPWHLVVAERLAQGREVTAEDTYEWHQPPLGYAWTALALRIVRLGEVPRAPDNPWYPYAQAALWHVPGDPADAWMPLLRTFWGLGVSLAVVLAWATVRALRPVLRDEAALAASLAAVLASLWPQLLFVGHAVSNDLAAVVCGSLLTYGLVLWAVRPRRRRRALGILAVAALLAPWMKLNALVLLAAPPMAAIALRRRSARPLTWADRPIAPTAAVALGAGVGLSAMAVAAPGALARLVEQAVWRGAATGAAPSGTGVLLLQLGALVESTWARFGWMNIALPRWLLWPSMAALAGSVLGFAVAFVESRDRDRRVLAFVAAPLLLAVGAALKNLLADPQPQGRLLFPAFASMVAIMACGAPAMVPRPWRSAAPWLAGAALVVLNAVAVARVIPAAYRGARGPLPDVALRIVPPEPALVARLDARVPALRQGLDLAALHGGGRIELAVATAGGPATIELALRCGEVELAASKWRVPAGDSLANEWLGVDWDSLRRPAEPGREAVLEAVLVSDSPHSSAQFWGSTDNVYLGGELSLGHTAQVGPGMGDGAHSWERRPSADLTVLVVRR